MTAAIARVTGVEAYDLIYPQHLAKLSVVDQKTMKEAMARSSRVWIGYDGDQVLACWGLQPPTLLSDRAHLWLYTTEHLQDHVFIFIRYSQRAVQEMLEIYPTIYGFTEVGNSRAIRWLRWLGAVFYDPHNGAYPFEIRADHG